MIIDRQKAAQELREIADWVEFEGCDRIRLEFRDEHGHCTLTGGYRVTGEWIAYDNRENWGIITHEPKKTIGKS
jgi:hypothetical protein